jgi:hypothetical protein
MNLELFRVLSKYPFFYNDEFFDSKELKQNKTCIEKCKDQECVDFYKNKKLETEYLCEKGYNNIRFTINEFSVLLNGLIFEDNNTVPGGRKDVRKEWIVSYQSLDHFKDNILEIDMLITRSTKETTEKNFSMFHDFKTSMSILFNCTQDIINKLPGNSFLDKLEQSDKSFKDLYNALELVTSQLRMIDVIINPKSIVFGNKKTINIYRLFEKIKVLFSHISSKKRAVDIFLNAENWIGDSQCYESIEFIPLILIDNALKYSAPDSNIEIKFEQTYKKVKVFVRSIGPFVKDDEVEKIFDKFYRGQTAESFSKEGIGMGLWIARQVLIAHNSTIRYYKDAKETRPLGLNIFEFELTTI